MHDRSCANFDVPNVILEIGEIFFPSSSYHRFLLLILASAQNFVLADHQHIEACRRTTKKHVLSRRGCWGWLPSTIFPSMITRRSTWRSSSRVRVHSRIHVIMQVKNTLRMSSSYPFEGENAEAYLSPDDKFITFQAHGKKPGTCDQIYMMLIDGSRVKRISTGAGLHDVFLFSFWRRQDTIPLTQRHVWWRMSSGTGFFERLCVAALQKVTTFMWLMTNGKNTPSNSLH